MYDYKSLVPLLGGESVRLSHHSVCYFLAWPRLLTELINSSSRQFLLDNEARPSQSRADPNSLKSDQDSHRNQLLIARHCHNCLCVSSPDKGGTRLRLVITPSQGTCPTRHAGYAAFFSCE